MQRWLVVFALLCFVPGFAWAQDTCTVSATTDWTAIGDDIAPCTETDDDAFVIPTGVVVTVTTGSSIDFSVDDGDTSAGITVEDNGTLIVEAGAAIALGGAGLTVESGGTFTANGLVLDPPNAAAATIAFDESAPSTTDYATVGDIVHCPGDAGGVPIEDCEADGVGNEATNAGVSAEIALCWPDARYKDVAGDTIPGRRFFDDWVAEFQVASGNIAGDVVTFWDPEPGRLGRKARDVNASYEVVDVGHAGGASACIYLNVEQDGQNSADQGYGLAERSVGYAVINVAATAGVRTISTDDADANYDAVAADNQRKARYLTCPDADAPSGAYVQPGWSAGIIDTDDEGLDASNDSLTLDTHGIRADIAAGDECFIDYGWARGDPVFAWRPVTITSATDEANNGASLQTSREDSNVDFQTGSIVTLNYVIFDTVGHVNFDEVATLDANNLWMRDTCATDNRNAFIKQDNQILNRWQLTGADNTDDNCHGVIFDAVSNVTLNDWNTRHLADDTVFTVTGAVSMDINRIRVSFTGGDGTNSQQIFNGSTSGDYVTITDLLCEDCGEDASAATDNVFQMNDTADDGTVVLRVTNSAYIAFDSGMTTEQGATGNDTGQEFRNLYILGHEAANIGLGDINYLNRFTIRESTVTQAANGYVRAADKMLEVTDGLFISNTSTTATPFVLADALDLFRNVGIINQESVSTGSGDRIVSFSGAHTYPMRFDRVTIASNAGDAGNAWERVINADAGSPDDDPGPSPFIVTGLLVHGFHDDGDADSDAAIGWFDAGDPTFDASEAKNWCFSDNDTDIHTTSDEDAPTTTVRDEDPGFYDKAAGDFRLKSNSRFAKQGCGAQNAGAADMWALRVRNINPLESGDSWFVPVLHTDGGGAY